MKDFDKKPFVSTNRVGYNVRKVNKVNAVYYEQKDRILICTTSWVEVNSWWRVIMRSGKIIEEVEKVVGTLR